MKTNFILLSFSVVCLTMVSCNPKKGKEVLPSQKPIYISGNLTGEIQSEDSIRVYFGGEIPFDKKIGVYQSLSIVNKEGEFSFQLPCIDKPERLTLVTFRNRKEQEGYSGARFDDALRDYIVEPGDSINITIDRQKDDTQFYFSGRGSEKFKCRWDIDRLGVNANWKFIRGKIQSVTQSEILKRFERKISIADSLISKQIWKLDTYKKVLNPRIYQVMKADIIGEINGALKIIYWKADGAMGKHILSESEKVNLCRRMVEESRKVDLDEDVLALSPFYIRYLSSIVPMKLILDHPGEKDYEPQNIKVKRYSDFCLKLRKDFSGLLREKLLIYNLRSIRVQDTYGLDDCLRESYELIQTPDLKEIIRGWYKKKVRGAEAYNFALPDTTGTVVRLSDFRGKIVYIDIWFTGCGGCAALASEVDKTVYPEFRDHSDVVFLSISFDKDREQWLRSVREEKYGLKEYVNLYTDGMGLNHPFMKYYNVSGGPTTMLIDRNGKIYSAAPPKHGKMPELIKLIEEALQ